ncbi:MAG TPA: transglycosylase SLT domain-containing protein [Planktothrix sp.]|jgi:soluble lytic murein transglycosylase-like protein/TolA-binding protein
MRITHLTLALAASATLSIAGCVAQTGAQSWPDTLQALPSLSSSAQVAQVLQHRNAFGVSEKEKQEAAYILGRLLQSEPPLLPMIDPTASAGQTANAAPLKAVALFREAAKLPALHEPALTHAIESATAAGDEKTLKELLDAELDESKDPQKQAQYNYALAQSLLRANDFDSAAAFLEATQAAAPDSNYAAGASYFLAQAALAGHYSKLSPEKAIQTYRAYLSKSPDGRFARDIVTQLKSLASQKEGAPVVYTPTAADHALFAQVYFESRDYHDTLAELADAPANAKLTHKAICLARTGKIDEAKQALLDSIKVEPTHNYAPTASLITDYLTREKSKQFWQQVLNAKPAKADAALWNIAIRSDPPESSELFRRLLAAYPTSEFAPESEWWLFWNYAKKAPGNPAMIAEAIPIAHQGLEKYPETRAAERFAFWLGKMHELMKKPDQAAVDYQYAVGHFPHSYYGYRAKARLAALPVHVTSYTKSGAQVAQTVKPVKDPLWSTHPGREDYSPQWKWPIPEQFLNDNAIAQKYGDTFAELYRLQQLDECLQMMPPSQASELKAAIQAKAREPLPAINTATKNLSGVPSHSSLHWQMAYPLVYAAEVHAEAQAKGVDPLLVHALIREESRYNHRAVSRSNAIGLMQLLPATAAGVAKRLQVPFKHNDDFFEPAVNIKLGTDYLSYVLGRYSGNAMFAVASYNGGPNAVKHWLTLHEQSNAGDYDYFVENIPTRETRDYVRKVFGAYWNYVTIYAHKSQEQD